MRTDLVVLAASCLLPEHALDSARFDFAVLAPDPFRLGLESPTHIPALMPSRRVSQGRLQCHRTAGNACVGSELSCNPCKRSAPPVPRTAPTDHNVCAGDTRACPSTHQAQCDGACNPCKRLPQHPPPTMCVLGTLARAPAPTRHNVTVHATLAHATRKWVLGTRARAPAPTERNGSHARSLTDVCGSLSFKFTWQLSGT
jgi:hypothetical protein